MPAPLPPERRRSEIRLTRFTRVEDARLRRAAADRDTTVAAFIRDAALAAITAPGKP